MFVQPTHVELLYFIHGLGLYIIQLLINYQHRHQLSHYRHIINYTLAKIHSLFAYKLWLEHISTQTCWIWLISFQKFTGGYWRLVWRQISCQSELSESRHLTFFPLLSRKNVFFPRKFIFSIETYSNLWTQCVILCTKDSLRYIEKVLLNFHWSLHPLGHWRASLKWYLLL